MSKVAAWHSAKLGIDVYHDESECWDGNNIEPRHFRHGRGPGRRQCITCGRLERERAEREAALRRLALARALRNR
jgi:hypothetical protein